MLRRLVLKFIPEKVKHQYRLNKYPDYQKKYEKNEELNRLKAIPRYVFGETDYFLNKKIEFVDNASLFFIYDEIFEKEVYKFITKNPNPYIIDAGANIGLSIIYFKKLYPNAEIIAFEPDQKVFEVLEHNVKSFDLENVKLIKKALWNEETTLTFMSEGADGGRIATQVDKQQLIEVKTTRLREFLNKKVDFLKIDIEGAEVKVLEDCKDLLLNVENIFVEYHSFSKEKQDLSLLIRTLEEAGYRYVINSPGLSSAQPFVKRSAYLGMDMQLNIYAYRN